MLDLGTSKCAASIFITAAFAAPSAGAAVVCTRNVPSGDISTRFWRARGITRTLKVRFESLITHNMQMKMEYRLTRARTGIGDNAEIPIQAQRINGRAHCVPESTL